MRFYFRLAKGIGVSMPWWLAIIVYPVFAALWLAGLVVVGVIYGLFMLTVWGVDRIAGRKGGQS
jgi:hypothetical protein